MKKIISATLLISIILSLNAQTKSNEPKHVLIDKNSKRMNGRSFAILMEMDYLRLWKEINAAMVGKTSCAPGRAGRL